MVEFAERGQKRIVGISVEEDAMVRSIHKVGYIGLGNVGVHLASNLIKAGYSLIVHDMKKERVQLLVEKGALAANSAKEIGREADVIMLSLPNPRISDTR